MPNNKCIILLSMLVLAACGGGVDNDFAGTWSGIATFTSAGVPAQSTTATFSFRVEDGVLLVPGCNGPLHVPGDGRRASWTGQEVCQSPTPSCPSTTITTLEYEAVLVSDDRIQTRGVNRADGCGLSSIIIGSFEGVRQ